ncbi:SDR family NAD(P)-dependent oxidoreductase [Planobispora siamensis]|uniref:Oxidoreductase n=1 Tax=Planobispora siamensis TaxID=936338 RepID=A0A8J3WHD1_9ACTN|nr:SDR family oxidoreductase [Planobispora siamensis]GIH90409.1 oxidoreductase [Planobispora siamensis]
MRKPYVPEEILLTGKVAVVTGAARGLGRAIAETLRVFGAQVALCDRDPIDGFDDAFTMTVDVRDPMALEVFTQGVRERFGRVDVLVNNAGGTFHAAFAEVSPRGESVLIAENFTQVTDVIRRFLPLMPPDSSIVNVTSSEAHQAAPGFAVYAAMKAALESLTRSLALELAPRGIRVNAIAPDALPTGGEEAVRERMLADPLPFEPVRLPPLGRLGDPVEAAGAVVFLVSAMAGFVTGATLHVDGGIHAAGGWRRV